MEQKYEDIRSDDIAFKNRGFNISYPGYYEVYWPRSHLNKVIICLIESNENTIVTFSYDRGLKGMIQGPDLTQELCFV